VSTANPEDLVGKTIGSYIIVARAGRGGMGVVYQAKDTKLGRTVALKFLPAEWSHDEDARLRFVREAQAASATNHPNICTIHDIETAPDGQLFIVMAYYDGQTLKQRLTAGPLAVDEALDIATQIADGLAKAHAQGVVHRDLKPGNVMLTEDGVRIVDFGLATFADALKLTAEHSTLGTAAYMSPEQVRGLSADARSDVWAVGVMLYEMLTGHVPFQGSHPEAIAYAVRHEMPAQIRASRPDVGEAVEQLVFRAMHKEPSVRFADGRALARALRQVRGYSLPLDLRTQSVAVQAAPAPRREDRRWRTWLPVAASLVAIAAGAAVWSFWPADRLAIVIAPVANQTGDASLQPYRLALTHSLERALLESTVVRAVPHTQVVQILHRFLVNGVDVTSRDAIQALSTNSGAAVVVVPSLVYENGAMRARAELVNPATATTVREAVETAAKSSLLAKETAAELIEALAPGIEERFRERWRFTVRSARPSLRFRSLDAAKAFEEGLNAFDEFEYAAARAAFEAAGRDDPDQAVIAAWTSRVNQVLGIRDGAAKSGALALSLLSPASSSADRAFVEAVAAESAGNTALARARYEDLVDRFSDEPQWLMELASFHERQTERAAAIETYHRVLRADARLPRPHLFLCRLYNSTGTNDAGLAKQHGERARDAYRAIGALGGEAQATLCLVDILRVGDAAQRSEARRIAANALEIYQRLGWPFNLARAYHYSALAAGKDDITAAAAFWEQSLSLARQVGNGSLEATVLANLGVKYHELGDLARALEYYRQSYQLNETRGDELGAAYSRANVGALMVQSGNEPDDGLRYLETALKYFTGRDSNFEMFCRQNLAEYYRHTGQFALADRELNRALDLASRHGFADDRPSLLLDRARLAAARGQYVSARTDLLDALDDDAGPETDMRIELGLVLAAMADFGGARQALEQAEREIGVEAARYLEPRLRAAFGRLEYESGRWREASADFARVASLDDGTPTDAAIVQARAYAASIAAETGRDAEARAAARNCIDAARRMRRAELEAHCRLVIARTDIEAGRAGEGAAALAEIRDNALGPEIQARVHYWRGRAATLNGDASKGQQELAEARRLVGGVRELIPVELHPSFSDRPDIRLILN
jgi:tetratricopeptide (TPR) repeat protein